MFYGDGFSLSFTTESVGKSAEHWLSVIGKESISASNCNYWFNVLLGWVSAIVKSSDIGVVDIRAGSNQCVHVIDGFHNQSHMLVHHIWLLLLSLTAI